jgi:phospholipid/cholesterol/gamma-HCH transport system ATP-binding protein
VTDDPRNIIEVSGLCNRFGDFIVHENLDLQVRQGEIIGVVGGSGSGKSVLMRSILALNKPQSGSIDVLGRNALSPHARDRLYIERNTGVLFQNGALFSSLSVLENVLVPLKEHSTLPARLMTELAMVKIQLAGLEPDAAFRRHAQAGRHRPCVGHGCTAAVPG